MPAQIPFDLPHQPSLARDDLIVSEANRLALSAIEAWPAWSHPVTLIVGPPGSGKSHLAAIWQTEAGASRFGASSIPAVGGERSFAALVDDIDSGDLDETALFHLVNAARLGHGTVLLTSRRHPVSLDLRLADLKSRLKAATIAELGAPDDPLLTAVLAKLFADRQIGLDPKLLAYLVERMERSLAGAGRLVAEIDRRALASKKRISRLLIQDVLRDLDGSQSG